MYANKYEISDPAKKRQSILCRVNSFSSFMVELNTHRRVLSLVSQSKSLAENNTHIFFFSTFQIQLGGKKTKKKKKESEKERDSTCV